MIGPCSITPPWAGRLSCCSWHRVLPGTSWHHQGRSNTWTSLLPSRAAAAAEQGSGLTRSVQSSQEGALQMERMFYQERSCQPELSPLTRPRWQNTTEGGIHQRHCSMSKSQDTKWHKGSFLKPSMHNLPSSLNYAPQGFQTVHNVYICL